MGAKQGRQSESGGWLECPLTVGGVPQSYIPSHAGFAAQHRLTEVWLETLRAEAMESVELIIDQTAQERGLTEWIRG